MIELKKLQMESTPAALEMARKYRLLKEPDAVLRWNSCARFINGHAGFKPDASQAAGFLLNAYETPH